VIVLDASVLIAYLDANDRHHRPAMSLLAREIDDDLAISVLTLAEVLVGPARAGRLDAVRAVLDDLRVQELPLAAGAAARLAQIRAATNLKLPDCCVLLAAESANARLATFGTRLHAAATARNVVVLDR
jgi:predicted nucleic acid-binding protein